MIEFWLMLHVHGCFPEKDMVSGLYMNEIILSIHDTL